MDSEVLDIERLKTWFLKSKRDLPWRKDPTPYQVWISEVMLQQTQVSIVIEYYLRWMELFPSIEELAAAPLSTVIKAWEGLGYYSRARRLHEAAQILVAKYQGMLPAEEKELLAISGLGPYTAGAILSFAYHQKKAAIDGNVMRVITRYKAIAGDISKRVVIKEIREIVERLLPEREPWVIMEAFIELGALLCKKKPVCHLCPLKLSCRAYETQETEKYPVKNSKQQLIKLERDVLVIESEEYILVRHETNQDKVMAHLWEFPYLEKQGSDQRFPELFGVYFTQPPIFQKQLRAIAQHFTKYAARLYPSLWEVAERPTIPGYQWIHKTSLHQYPFSSGHRKILHQL